ncbi:MAG: prepilin-type N-terminal cleavage/methylation domain-containing protein [Planctomycetota bacterium]|nr:prepilin-type N-terminal cleavage/methylation domain-containing protein [Planctomycetota bacterium]
MRSAFTLIELLVVISIMALLAGAILAAGKVLMRTRVVTQTSAILAGVALGLETSAADRGSAPTPAPHPLAGTRAPRAPFVRDGSTAGYASGTAVASAGMAYRASDPAAVPSAGRSTVLLPGDRYLGASSPSSCPLPLLFGAERQLLGIIGTGTGIDQWRRLPQAVRPYSSNGSTLLTPLDGPRYPASEFLIDAGGTSADRIAASKQAIEAMLPSEQLSEIAALGALKTSSGAPLAGGLLNATGDDGARWEPGRYQEAGRWQQYDLAGTALYDAWGNELFYRPSTDGRVVIVISAGPDGVLAVHPGNDGVYQSPGTGALAGDDRDGSKDNLVEGTDR